MSAGAERPLRVLHVITGLRVGGAETMLANLLEHSGESFESEVISLRELEEAGPPAKRIEALGVPLRGLNMRPYFPNPLLVGRLANWIRRSQPDVVQTWMYHANLIGGAAAKLAGAPVVWGIHHNAADFENLKAATARVVQVGGWASRRLPEAVVCVAEASRAAHARLGYDPKKLVVIPNGFDTRRFRPDLEARRSKRAELGIPEDAPVVGMFARLHPLKDHQGFLRAAGMVQARLPQAHFVLCGEGVEPSNRQLAQWAAEAGLGERLHLLGPREDVPALLAALDVYVSSSKREAFPMVIGEAMACGTPCAATDAGDSALLIGETGRIAPVGDAQALAEAALGLLCLPPEERGALGAAARSRVEREYNLDGIVRQYAQLYRSLAQGGR